LGYLAKVVSSSAISDHVATHFVASGVIYLMMIGGLVYFLPWLSGLSHREISGYFGGVRKYVYRRTI